MIQTRSTLLEVVAKTIVTHTVTCFIMGLLASTILDNTRFFAESSLNLMIWKGRRRMIAMSPPGRGRTR